MNKSLVVAFLLGCVFIPLDCLYAESSDGKEMAVKDDASEASSKNSEDENLENKSKKNYKKKGQKKTTKKKTIKKKKAAINEEEPGVIYKSGIIMGHVLYVDPKENWVFVLPSERDFGRKYFYFDKQTLFTEMVNGEQKKIKKNQLIEGSRVVVRYLSRNSFYLTEEVFLVRGEYEKIAQYRKRVIKSATAAGGHGGGEKKDGGHEKKPEAKKPEGKKDGGHH